MHSCFTAYLRELATPVDLETSAPLCSGLGNFSIATAGSATRVNQAAGTRLGRGRVVAEAGLVGSLTERLSSWILARPSGKEMFSQAWLAAGVARARRPSPERSTGQ